MSGSSHEDQDQRTTNGMEDSTAMTVEFLQARLLSERSVSRAARQRADELAKRVEELEENLKIVSLQRKKAEKATEAVLAILANDGLTDPSEGFNSDSEQEMFCGSEVGNDKLDEKETPTSVEERNVTEAYSSSEFESSPSTGRSLSWKSGKNSLQAIDKRKFMESARRRSSSLASAGSSSRKLDGKSCRRTKRRELRPEIDESQHLTSVGVPHVRPVAKCSEDLKLAGTRNNSLGSEHNEENCQQKNSISAVSKGGRHAYGPILSKHGTDGDRERSVQDQAQLIVQCEAEEQAQREWEAKFREKNGCTTDVHDHGNHSDVTEEMEDTRASEKRDTATTSNSKNKEVELQTSDISANADARTNSDLSPAPVSPGFVQDQKCSTIITVSEFPASEFAFPTSNGSTSQFSADSSGPRPSSSLLNGSLGRFSDASSSPRESNFLKGNASRNGYGLALTTTETSRDAGSVLEALQLAKSSLKQKINRVPSTENGSFWRATGPPVPTPRIADRPEIPVGYPGLFRLPTDFQIGGISKPNYLDLGSQLSLPKYSYGTAGGEFLAGPYTSSTGNRLLTTSTFPTAETTTEVPPWRLLEPQVDAGSGLPTYRRFTYPDPIMSSGLPSSSKYPVPDVTPQYNLNEGFSRPFHGKDDAGVPPFPHFSFNDHGRPNPYR